MCWNGIGTGATLGLVSDHNIQDMRTGIQVLRAAEAPLRSCNSFSLLYIANFTRGRNFIKSKKAAQLVRKRAHQERLGHGTKSR